ncbi:muramidase family protein [Salirhabdus sp. Marseille-P4669]|uniref:muramidase family protein n=1 Tax=Salirhabdus sp. Marseille-P4669 TaxID=2042310 RepID=UPI000C7D229F|nr:LysM peptidoglycan-binding domain-containing protein [Salirhabdus sp. Marseille-P4669]
MFQHHRIEQNDNGYTLILYLDEQLTEFAQSFGEKSLNDQTETDLKQGVYQYIREKVPNLKVNAVKVVLGSMMIATIPLAQDALVSHAQVTDTIEQHQITYNVAPGDTLYSIAKKFNIGVNDVKAANNLTNNTIKQGQRLIIPSTTYTVKAGDTLYSLAKKYDLSVDTIKSANQLTTNTITIGSTLQIPTNQVPTAIEEAPVEHTRTTSESYTVKAGDTLYGIANKFNVSVNHIKQANTLSSNTITIGQQLIIPAETTITTPTPTETSTPIVDDEMDNYTVKGGDTLIGIASLFKISVDAIKEANGLTSDTIMIGQVLSIPQNTSPTTETVKSTPAFYTVQSGDSLYAIANKFGMNVVELKQINGLTGDNLYVGQTLRLDTTMNASQNTITYKTHTVQSGDNIWKLSEKYGIPQAELLRANNLTANATLSIGQTLQIPVHNIAVQPTVSEKHGEFLDWWTEAQYVFPIGSTAKVTDFQTGKSFYVKRTIGANHADVEPVTAKDTAIIKDVFGGFNWKERAVIVEVNGHKIAGSMTSMPHDVQYIKDNNFNGHTDIHFKNSTRHKDGQITPGHQQQVQIAAGLIQQ